jgi:sigma-B regulation protein RsbU (phosphoserine phosphatase)
MQSDVSHSKHHLESIFDSITEPIFSVSPDYTITRLNKKFENIMGKTFREILGRKCFSQLYARDTICPFCPLSSVIHDGMKKTFKVNVSEKTIYSVSFFPLQEKEGGITEMVEFARDITEEESIRKELSVLQQQTLDKSLQLAEQNKELEIAYNKLSRELTLARIVQRGILPQSLPQLPELDTAVFYLPMEDVGGDLYDFVQITPDLIGIILADVSGHGVPAAFIGAMAKMSFYLHAHSSGSTARVLTQVNADMCNNLHTDEFFFTTSYCLIDLITNRVKCSNAGHTPLLVYRKKERTLEQMINRGLIMGLSRDSKYGEVEITLKKGDRLIFYTDGLNDCKNETETFGFARFQEIFMRTCELPVGEQIRAIERELAGFLGDIKPSDDVSIIIIEVLLDDKFSCFGLDREFDSPNDVTIHALRHPLEFERIIGGTLGTMDTHFFHDQAIRNTKFAIYEALNMYYHSGSRNGDPIYFSYSCTREKCSMVIVDSRFILETPPVRYFDRPENRQSLDVIAKNIDEFEFRDEGKKIILTKYNR